MIATFVRQRTPAQRITLLVLAVLLADFSLGDGCDCDAARTRSAAPITTTAEVAR